MSGACTETLLFYHTHQKNIEPHVDGNTKEFSPCTIQYQVLWLMKMPPQNKHNDQQ